MHLCKLMLLSPCFAKQTSSRRWTRSLESLWLCDCCQTFFLPGIISVIHQLLSSVGKDFQ